MEEENTSRLAIVVPWEGVAALLHRRPLSSGSRLWPLDKKVNIWFSVFYLFPLARCRPMIFISLHEGRVYVGLAWRSIPKAWDNTFVRSHFSRPTEERRESVRESTPLVDLAIALIVTWPKSKIYLITPHTHTLSLSIWDSCGGLMTLKAEKKRGRLGIFFPMRFVQKLWWWRNIKQRNQPTFPSYPLTKQSQMNSFVRKKYICY